jgi:hypothetical protein
MLTSLTLSMKQEELIQHYRDVGEPLLLRNSGIWKGFSSGSVTPTVEGFLHAYSLVSSRAFLVDAYHGLSMVPIADALVFFRASISARQCLKAVCFL